jgi:H+/Cl- antiporter ClcA
MPEQSDLAQALQDVTRHAQLIVREEIELAKAEVAEKATKLAKGVAVGAAAGVFILAGLIYFLHAVAWFIWQQTGTTNSFWLGFLIVAVALFLLALLAAFIAYRFVKGGSPPTPQMAIKEAQLVRETVSASTSTSVERTGA